MKRKIEKLTKVKTTKTNNQVTTLTKHNSKSSFFARRFVLTVHKQNKVDYENLVAFFNSEKVKSACIAREFGKHKIHPHFQVYFVLHEQRGMLKSMEQILGHTNFHLEVAQGTHEDCIAYVYAINKSYEGGFVDYNKNCNIPWNYNPAPVNFWNNLKLKPFQQEIVEIAKSEYHRRHIYYFYEPKGNTGKTILAEYLHIYYGAIITGGKEQDMKHAVARWEEITGADPVIIIVDVARSDDLNLESCKAIEVIKNSLFFDGKYESAMAHSFPKPHMFIFSNKSPVLSFFSEDRWKVAKIENDQLLWETV